jgi:hypothetical protein
MLRGLMTPGDPPGREASARYTPAMRRWFCVFVLLAGFSGEGYAWGIRTPRPVPIERRIDLGAPAGGTRLTPDWWRRS